MSTQQNKNEQIKALLFITNRAYQYYDDKDAQQVINKAINIANTLKITMNCDKELLLVSGMLSESLESALTYEQEIINVFGINVFNIINSLTDSKSEKLSDKRASQLIRAQSLSRDAKLIELAKCLYELTFLPKSFNKETINEHINHYRFLAVLLASVSGRLYQLILRRLHVIDACKGEQETIISRLG